MERGRYDRAEEEMRQFLRLAAKDRSSPNFASNLFVLGEALLHQGRAAEARAAFAEALEIWPSLAQAARRLQELGAGDAKGSSP